MSVAGGRRGRRGGTSQSRGDQLRAKHGGQRPAPRKRNAEKASRAPGPATPAPPLPPLRLGFARGVSPGKWADRWARAVRDQPLELVPLPYGYGTRAVDDQAQDPAQIDVLIERAAPGQRPGDSDRHAMLLYAEDVALVLSADHDLADQDRLAPDDLALVRLLDHTDHPDAWPEAAPWDDPSWKPQRLNAALDLVSTGAGAILLPSQLARHLAGKREHAVVPVDGLEGSTVWATWAVDRDADDVQHLVGIMRGRTSRSSR